jgi:hypothetical protein
MLKIQAYNDSMPSELFDSTVANADWYSEVPTFLPLPEWFESIARCWDARYGTKFEPAILKKEHPTKRNYELWIATH